MKTKADDDFAQVTLSGIELMAVIQALRTECESWERNKVAAGRVHRDRLVDQYAIWQQMARAALENCRLALQTAEDETGLAPEHRYTPAEGAERITLALVTSSRSVAKMMVVEYCRRYGSLDGGPKLTPEERRAAQRDLEQLEPEGRC